MTDPAPLPVAEAVAGAEPLLRIGELTVEFKTRAGPIRANDKVSLDIRPGETLVRQSVLGAAVPPGKWRQTAPNRATRP